MKPLMSGIRMIACSAIARSPQGAPCCNGYSIHLVGDSECLTELGSQASAVRRGSGVSLLSRQARKVRKLRDRRRIPFACEGLGLRRIEAHGQIEGSPRRRQLVRLTILAGALVLEKEGEPSVGIVFERHPATNGKGKISSVSGTKSSSPGT